MKANEELDTFIDRLINAELHRLIKEDIAPYTCQLLEQNPTKGLIPFASGVMAQLGDAHYILTASHVIENWSDSNKLFVEIKDGHVSIVGKGCGSEIDKVKKIDTAYIKLKPEIVPLLKERYQFLSIDKFLYHDKILDEENYCVCGFPVGNPKDERGRTIGVGYFLKPTQDKIFDHYGFDAMSHYVLEFRGKAINIKTNLLEKIKVEHYGLSGGGLWYTSVDHDGDKFTSAAYLIGIMTEFRRGKYDCLIANRVEPILASIHEEEGVDIEGRLANLNDTRVHPIYELKPGNLLLDTINSTYCVVKTVHPSLTIQSINHVIFQPEDDSLEPIPINPENLFQAGFQHTKNYYRRQEGEWICAVVPFPDSKFGWFVDEEFVIEIEYVHELQNCFFVTTDLYLELNLQNKD